MTTSLESIAEAANRKNLRLLNLLRGLAFCVQVLIIWFAYYGLNIVLPVVAMISTSAFLAAFNLYSFLRVRSAKPVTPHDLFLALFVDVVVLTALIYLSGGTSNPFVSFYMLPVILGAVMLSAGLAWSLYGVTLLGYLALALFGSPVHTPPAHGHAPHDVNLVNRFDLHMNGMMIGYFLCAGALVAAVTRIKGILAVRDAELAAIRTQAIEQDHIVRMGLLAAGAAHELGTPLTTLSVVLQDWKDFAPPGKKADREAELETLLAQVDRCKTIISGILSASGEPRGEGARVEGLGAFLHRVTGDWGRLNATDVHLRMPDNAERIVGDKAFEQVLVNVLDNAREAATGSPIGIDVTIEADTLKIEVQDAGPGFAQDMLTQLGTPYLSSKSGAPGNAGRGLGLFLARNTMARMGGHLHARNQAAPQTGAVVTLSLPFAAIRVSA